MKTEADVLGAVHRDLTMPLEVTSRLYQPGEKYINGAMFVEVDGKWWRLRAEPEDPS